MSIEINGLEVALGRLDLFTNVGKVEQAITKATLTVTYANDGSMTE
jgi:hypothetical protein